VIAPSMASTQPRTTSPRRSTLARSQQPCHPCRQSYGGSVIIGAGTDDRVAGLVYIAPLAPDADETSQTQQSNFPKTDVFFLHRSRGRTYLAPPEGIDCFAGDLSEQEKKLVWATQCVRLRTCFNAKVEETAWRSKPSWYIVARMTHPSTRHGTGSLLSGWAPPRTEVASSHSRCSRTRAL